MSNNNCKYNGGCIHPANPPFDQDYCIYHSNNKGMDEVEFHNKIRNLIKSGVHEFVGYVFTWFIDFRGISKNQNSPSFDAQLKFEDCKFIGSKDIDVKYMKNDQEASKVASFCASFREIEFRGGLHIKNCLFKNSVNLQYSKFIKDQFLIVNSKFEGEVYLNNTEFLNCNLNFTADGEMKTIFSKSVVAHNLKFDFKSSKLEKKVNIGNIIFQKGLILTDSNFKCLNFRFDHVELESEYTFFNRVQIESPTILFTNCNFNSILNNFKGFKPKGRTVSFENSTFTRDVTFEDAFFDKLGDVNYYDTSFRNTNFISLKADFKKVTFNCGTVDFSNALFNCKTTFTECEFNEGSLFRKTKFSKLKYERALDRLVLMEHSEASLEKDCQVNFTKIVFDGDKTDFTEAEFSCEKAIFSGCNLDSDFILIDNRVCDNMNISFINLYMKEFKRFSFRQPIFTSSTDNNEGVQPLIEFENINFNPIKTSFENIFDPNLTTFKGLNKKLYFSPSFCILFRYCYLKDVYFISTSTSNFSFYKSFYDEAIFISSHWKYEIDKINPFFKYKRKNIIFEDYLLNGKLAIGLKCKEPISDRIKHKKQFQKYKIEDLNGNEEIAALYRRFKTSLDRTKDYIQAGWFYFNEYEMLRLYYKQSTGLIHKSKYWLYSIYKYLGGYGEKPLWSFIWFILLTFIISIINILNGFKFRSHEINYDVILDSNVKYSFNYCILIKDLIKGMFFTISRVLPTSYIPIEKSDFGTLDSIGLAIGVLTAFLLIFLITLIFSGLKRHFRRF